MDDLWKFKGELFMPSNYETQLAAENIGVYPAPLKTLCEEKINSVLAEATLADESGKRQKTWMQTGGKEGRHTEHLGFVLAEMQYLQRAYPDSEW